MGENSNPAIFSLLPEGKSRWRFFGTGFALECLALALLIWIPILLPHHLEIAKQFWTIPVTAPPVVAWKPQPKPRPVAAKRPEVARVVKTAEPIVAPKPKLIAPVFTSPIARRPVPNRRTPAPEVHVAQALPDMTSLGSSALPDLKRPQAPVQTGGFGDPNGVPMNNRTGHSPNINQLGAFDLPNGPGHGNGTGGAKGIRGTVASTGFGNGVAISGGGRGDAGPVRQGVFADESKAVAAPRVRKVADTGNQRPVVILYKPKPRYTAEAQQLHVEGEVLLDVVFTASGQVQILRVVQGLGHGLDEAAVAAARQIRFRPAMQDGHPVDSTATVHILFELAY